MGRIRVESVQLKVDRTSGPCFCLPCPLNVGFSFPRLAGDETRHQKCEQSWSMRGSKWTAKEQQRGNKAGLINAGEILSATSTRP